MIRKQRNRNKSTPSKKPRWEKLNWQSGAIQRQERRGGQHTTYTLMYFRCFVIPKSHALCFIHCRYTLELPRRERPRFPDVFLSLCAQLNKAHLRTKYHWHILNI